ncbi:MBL fold metallo-hydrolase [Gordonia sp. VNQ95]|jgi:ribonuclease BN (tRNA processing enzyme)|uniref:MBL fold metallo-hydrolase n=1 Tax=Gordonia sp. VNQ95 TaxID=3156619 RepID=UPI0032B5A061
MSLSRRELLTSTGLAASAVGVSGFAAGRSRADSPLPSVPSTGAHLVLLGTAAGPVPFIGRKGISTALVVDGHIYLIDMGHGAFDQFSSSGIDAGSVDSIFVTHLHSDHLADLFTFLWLRFGGVTPLTHAVSIYGPGSAGALAPAALGNQVSTVNPGNPTPGLKQFLDNSIAACAYDINSRMRDENWPDIRTRYNAHEIEVPDVGAGPLGDLAPSMRPFPVMSDDRVRVSAILVRHPPIFPSFGFRFDTKYGSVAFSGDTTITPNMVTLAKGADVLVHEAIDLTIVGASGLTANQLQHHRNAHSDVRRIGREVAQPAGVKTLVLTHLAPGSTSVPDAAWKAQAQQGFGGQVIVGRDLAHIPL